MQRVSERHFGLLGAAFLLVALVLLLALPGMAGAKTPIAPRELVPDVAAPVTIDNAVDVVGFGSSLVFTADDGVDGSGVDATYYSVDGRAWTAGSSLYLRRQIRHKGAGLDAGSHTIQYYSTDMLGNAEAVQTCTITL